MTAPAPPPLPAVPAEPASRTVGPERLLVLGYGLLVVAAGARSAVQLATDAAQAPVAYSLSAAAAVVYLAGFLALRRAARAGADAEPRLAARTLAGVVAVVELAGVAAVGSVSVVWPAALGAASVWSSFGAGYLFLPLVLPVAVLGWLRRRP